MSKTWIWIKQCAVLVETLGGAVKLIITIMCVRSGLAFE